MQEQCDAVKPTISEVIDQFSTEDDSGLNDNQIQRLNDFLNYVVPVRSPPHCVSPLIVV